MRWGWIDRSPTPDADPPSKPHPDPQLPTPAQAAQIISTAWADPDLGPLVWLAVITGARRGELCALRWRHLDPIRGVLVIRASIAQVGVDVWDKDTKLHQQRHIAPDPDTIALFLAYHQARQRRAGTVGATLTPDAFVFSPSPNGITCRAPASLTRRYRRLVRSLGIRSTLHKLRHCSATELLAAAVDVRTVSGRRGHSEGGTTLAFYAAWVHQADQRASRILADLLPKPVGPLATEPQHTRPPSPYQVIATELRTAILDGTYQSGTVVPTVQQLAAAHHVAPSTAHRAITLLAHEQLITVTRGRRAVANACLLKPEQGLVGTPQLAASW